MEIRKDYKFYAAHRNQDLADKCSNIHGHKYIVSFFFKVERQGNITTLFGDFDAKIEPHLKENYDHGMLVDKNDDLYRLLQTGTASATFKYKKMDRPTSVENLCFELFKEVRQMGFPLDRLEIKETDTSTIIYNGDDFKADDILFNAATQSTHEHLYW